MMPTTLDVRSSSWPFGAVLTRRRRRHARRLLRRAFYRLEIALVVFVWVLPPLAPAVYERMVDQPFGVLVDAGRTGLPIRRTAVVLVPDPGGSRPLESYAHGLRNLEREPIVELMDAALWLWVDFDGRFNSIHSAKAVPYRMQVRRSGCLVEDIGRWQSSFMQVFRRPTVYEVGPCRPDVAAGRGDPGDTEAAPRGGGPG